MWDKTYVDGPINIWTFKAPNADGDRLPDALEPGFHINCVKSFLPEEAEPYTVIPSSPRRVFAGDDGTGSITAFLQFTSEDEAKMILSTFWLESDE